jgi:hypothetical protein
VSVGGETSGGRWRRFALRIVLGFEDFCKLLQKKNNNDNSNSSLAGRFGFLKKWFLKS